MEEKGKSITIEIDEEEEDLQALIIAEEEDQGMEVDIPPTHSVKKLPAYVIPCKGNAKVPKDLDETKSSLQTLLLPGSIMFEGMQLGHMLTMKFEYWDLADRKRFPHLQTRNLIK